MQSCALRRKYILILVNKPTSKAKLFFQLKDTEEVREPKKQIIKLIPFLKVVFKTNVIIKYTKQYKKLLERKKDTKTRPDNIKNLNQK